MSVSSSTSGASGVAPLDITSPLSSTPEVTGDNAGDTPSSVDNPSLTIGQSLSRRRVPTSTFIGETSEAARQVVVGTKRQREERSTGADTSGEDNTEEVDLSSNVDPTLPDIEVEGANAIACAEDFLPRYKLKASGETRGVSEVVKIAQHKDYNHPDNTMIALCENLFTMISCLVQERLVTSGLTVTCDERLVIYRQYYFEQCSVATMDSYLAENLFCYLSDYFDRDAELGVLKWPTFFTTYVRETYQNTPLSGLQRNRARALKHMSESDGMDYNFSLAIQKAVVDARAEINNRLSRLWRHPLDSGETPSGLFDVIRETTRTRDAFLRAKTSINKNFTSKKRHGPDYESALTKKTESLLEKMPTDYFPNYWMTFALFATPAPDNHALAIFKVEKVSDLQQKIVSADDSKFVNRNSRGLLRSNLRSGVVAAGSSSTSSRPPFHTRAGNDSPSSTRSESPAGHHKTITMNVNMQQGGGVSSAPPPTVADTEESLLMRAIEILQQAGKLPDGTFICQDDITKHSKRLAALTMAKITDAFPTNFDEM